MQALQAVIVLVSASLLGTVAVGSPEPEDATSLGSATDTAIDPLETTAQAAIERFLLEGSPWAGLFSGPADVQVKAMEAIDVDGIPVWGVHVAFPQHGKEAVLFFDGRDLSLLGNFLPTRTQLTGEKVEPAVIREVVGHERVSVVVHLLDPPGVHIADDVLYPESIDLALAAELGDRVSDLAQAARTQGLSDAELEEYVELADGALAVRNGNLYAAWSAAVLADLEEFGVEGLSLPDSFASMARLRGDLKAEDLAIVAAHPGVALVAHNAVVDAAPALAQSRIAMGANAANSASYTGGNNRIMSIDSGVTPSPCIVPAGSRNFIPGQTDTEDIETPTYPHGHGTAAAHIVAGDTSPGCPSRGVAYDAQLYNAKLFDQVNPVTEDDFFAALEHGRMTWTVHAVTTSIAGGGSDDGSGRWSRLYDRWVYMTNKPLTVAAGNNASLIAPPAGAFNVISVGAYDDHNTGSTASDDTLAPFTPIVKTPAVVGVGGARKKPDISMPGVGIDSVSGTNGGTISVQGTSFAAPHAGGLTGLYPTSYTGREKKCIMVNDQAGPAAGAGWDYGWGWGKPKWIGATADTRVNSAIGHQASQLRSVTLPAAKTLTATVVWHRELDTSANVVRTSDLDLRLIMGDAVAASVSSYDNVESASIKNTGATSVTAQVKLTGWYVPGGTTQPYSLCYRVW